MEVPMKKIKELRWMIGAVLLALPALSFSAKDSESYQKGAQAFGEGKPISRQEGNIREPRKEASDKSLNELSARKESLERSLRFINGIKGTVEADGDQEAANKLAEIYDARLRE